VESSVGRGSISGEQCRERFYTLRKSYRKFMTESSQTGNKAPKPFIYESLMTDILKDDPAFNPPVVKGSLGKRKKKSDEVSEEDESGEEQENGNANATGQEEKKIKKKKKGKWDELKEYFSERDEKFLQVMREMNATNNRLIEELASQKKK